MKTDKVTREDLRAIRNGETRSFELPTYAAVVSGKSSAYILGRVDGCRFECKTEPSTNTLHVTRYDR